jgi:hypothetical protein
MPCQLIRPYALLAMALTSCFCGDTGRVCIEVIDTSARHLTFRTNAAGQDCLRRPRAESIDVYSLRPSAKGQWHAFARPARPLPAVITYGVAPPGFTTDLSPGETAADPLQPGMTVRIWISTGQFAVGITEVTLTE